MAIIQKSNTSQLFYHSIITFNWTYLNLSLNQLGQNWRNNLAYFLIIRAVQIIQKGDLRNNQVLLWTPYIQIIFLLATEAKWQHWLFNKTRHLSILSSTSAPPYYLQITIILQINSMKIRNWTLICMLALLY